MHNNVTEEKAKLRKKTKYGQ